MLNLIYTDTLDVRYFQLMTYPVNSLSSREPGISRISKTEVFLTKFGR